jgi:protein arginine kinase activator
MKNRLCELCGSYEATLLCTRVVNNVRHEIHLCADCAALEGFETASSDFPEFSGELPDALFDSEQNELTGDPAMDVRCPHCNTTRLEFERSGLLGCSECYESFADDLQVLMRRLHGATQHLGRRPRPRRVFGVSVDQGTLREELDHAIAEEDFERAAALRDLLCQRRHQENNTADKA